MKLTKQEAADLISSLQYSLKVARGDGYKDDATIGALTPSWFSLIALVQPGEVNFLPTDYPPLRTALLFGKTMCDERASDAQQVSEVKAALATRKRVVALCNRMPEAVSP